jgi:hypothetical protein
MNQQDFGTVAGFFSQLAAVLAGFAFAGIITVIAAKLSSGDRAKDSMNSLGPLSASYLAMVMSSVEFAVIAGEGPYSGRGTTLMILAGSGFCAASLVLIYAVLVLLHGVEFDVESPGLAPAVSLIRNALIFGIGPIMILANSSPAAAISATIYGSGSGGQLLDYTIAITTVLSMIIGATLVVRSRRRARPRPSVRLIYLVSASTIALTVINLGAVCAIPMLLQRDAPGNEAAGVTAVLALFVLTVGVFKSATECRSFRRGL